MTETNRAVSCSVDTCIYNANGSKCNADHIMVSETKGHATNSKDTFCDTFQTK